jgi:NADPH:quinone reductase-like Zn-dependent oxidoreductase
MRAAIASSFGKPDDVIQVIADRPKPVLVPGSKKLLIRVHACSLSPGDVRMLLGEADFVKKPKGGFPYVPGGDVCGIVEEMDTELQNARFKVGDEVIGTWETFGEGGLAGALSSIPTNGARLRAPSSLCVCRVLPCRRNTR